MIVDLEDIDTRDGWILESRIERQGGIEFVPLMVQPLLSHILSSAGWHSFLHRGKYFRQREGDMPRTVRLGVDDRHVGDKISVNHHWSFIFLGPDHKKRKNSRRTLWNGAHE